METPENGENSSSIKDNKIFIYLRLRDDKRTLLKSRIREFAAIGKLLADFVKEIWEQFGLKILKIGCLEYVDANSDMVLICFRHDAVRQQTIISGVIPKKYQQRMLDEQQTKINLSVKELVDRMASQLDALQKAAVAQRLNLAPKNILSLIQHNINENGRILYCVRCKTAIGRQRKERNYDL